MTSPHVRLRTTAAVVMVLLAIGVSATSASARPQAGEPRDSGRRGIVVVQVNGLIDPSNASLIKTSLHDAARARASLVVFQLDGTGAVDTDTDALVQAVFNSPVPVVAWVGPSGGEAKGATALIALATSNVSVAAGAHIGPVVPVNYDDPGAVSVKQATAQVAVLERRNRPDAKNPASVVTDRLSGKTAVADGLIDDTQPTLFQFIVELDGHVLHTANGDVKVSTKATSGVGANRQVGVNQVVSFRKLDLVQQLAHTLNTPWVAYFLFLAGLSLMLFEFFTAGVGIAGVVGAVAFVGACFGFSHLPIAPWAVGLLVFGIFGLAVDLQAGGLGPWTFIGGASLIAGSFWLYDGAAALDPVWWILVLVIGATLLFVLSGMTAMVRSRFSTPTIGREELIGEMGVAEVGVDPDGVVRVRDALWRARTNRATPIAPGDAVRVVAVEGVMLEVEPEAGGARDYRDRSGSH
jgi:membrane-bound serine protease (ClpP class)